MACKVWYGVVCSCMEGTYVWYGENSSRVLWESHLSVLYDKYGMCVYVHDTHDVYASSDQFGWMAWPRRRQVFWESSRGA